MRSRRRPMYYILAGHEPVPLIGEDAALRWGEWFQNTNRHVDFTDLGFCTVSTVFLGVDYSFADEGPPIVFETMVFANPKPGETFPEEFHEQCWRYATWDEAVAGHADMIADVRAKFWQRRANGK